MILESLMPNLFLAILVVAAVYDVVLLKIPNLVCAALAALFIVAAMLAGNVNWISHVGAGLGIFLAGAVLFHFRIFGGGDIKLLAAGALWTGIWALPYYIAAVALLGGVVAIVFWVGRKLMFQFAASLAKWRQFKVPAILLDGAPIPYGLAIVGGLLLTALQTPMWHGEIHSVFLKYLHG
jgi:prepilin peptidase CpaA